MFGEVISIASKVKTVAASTAVDLKSAYGARKAAEPGYGRKGIVLVLPLPGAAADSNQAGSIQTSPDNSTWTNAQAYDAANGPTAYNVTLDRYIRVNNTSGIAGNGTNFLLIV